MLLVKVQGFKFHNLFRQTEESVAIYMSELRAVAAHCNFRAGGVVFVDELLGKTVLSS